MVVVELAPFALEALFALLQSADQQYDEHLVLNKIPAVAVLVVMSNIE